MPENEVISFSLDKQSEAALKGLIHLTSPGVILNGLFKLFNKLSGRAAGHIVKNFMSGQLLNRRTGAAARSVVGKAVHIDGLPAVRVGILRGPSVAYIGVQEYGTQGYNPDSPYPTIRPKNAKALAFPPEGSPALTAAGVARVKGPRDYEREMGRKLFFIPFRHGINAIGGLFEKPDSLKGRANISIRELKLVYLLLQYLEVKPKRFLYKGMLSYIPTIAKAIGEHFVLMFNQAQQLANEAGSDV